MPNASDLLTAGKIALELDVPAPKVKQAIAALKLEPSTKKGACAYYDSAAVAKIKKALK
jgi:hypothetical protein